MWPCEHFENHSQQIVNSRHWLIIILHSRVILKSIDAHGLFKQLIQGNMSILWRRNLVSPELRRVFKLDLRPRFLSGCYYQRLDLIGGWCHAHITSLKTILRLIAVVKDIWNSGIMVSMQKVDKFWDIVMAIHHHSHHLNSNLLEILRKFYWEIQWIKMLHSPWR